MPVQHTVLHEWHRPDEIASYEAQQLRHRGKFVIPFVLLSVAIIELFLVLPAYLLLKRISPETDFLSYAMVLSFLGFLTAAVFLCFQYCVYPRLLQKHKFLYAITSAGISFEQIGNPANTRRWVSLKGYWLSPHKRFPNLTVLHVLCRSSNKALPLVLPTGQLTEPLIATIHQYLPLIETPAKYDHIALSPLQYLTLLICTVAYSALAALFTANTCFTLLPVCAIFFLFLGPGTLLFLLLFTKRFLTNHNLQILAIYFNLAAIFLVVLFSLLLLLFRLSQAAR